MMHMCTRLVSCLFSGLAKNNKIKSMFVPFSRLFGHFESLAFFQKWRDKTYTKAVKKDSFVNFSRVKHLSVNFSKNCGYFD